jgi:uroporphyrinogen-III synthase
MSGSIFRPAIRSRRTRCWTPCNRSPSTELEESLKARGADVVEIPTYRWALPANTQPLIDLIEKLSRHEVDAVAFTNAAQVRNLFAIASSLGRSDSLRDDLARTLVASIGPVASSALREFGLAASIEASPPKLGPLVSALSAALSL